jgi:anti-anti-sigma factor
LRRARGPSLAIRARRAIVALLEIESERTGTTVRLALRGELDISTADQLETEIEALNSGGSERVVLDLRELEFIDSSGIRILVLAAKRFGEAGREFALIRGIEEVDRVLRLTGIDEQIKVLDEDAAQP